MVGFSIVTQDFGFLCWDLHKYKSCDNTTIPWHCSLSWALKKECHKKWSKVNAITLCHVALSWYDPHNLLSFQTICTKLLCKGDESRGSPFKLYKYFTQTHTKVSLEINIDFVFSRQLIISYHSKILGNC